MTETTKPRTPKIHRIDVTPVGGGTVTSRLVRASNLPAAKAYVAADTIRGRVASQDDLIDLRNEGVAVETAGEPEPAKAEG